MAVICSNLKHYPIQRALHAQNLMATVIMEELPALKLKCSIEPDRVETVLNSNQFNCDIPELS